MDERYLRSRRRNGRKLHWNSRQTVGFSESESPITDAELDAGSGDDEERLSRLFSSTTHLASETSSQAPLKAL